jgi:tRNA A-37 threonylcarbamoyl transferase component Bud32
MLESIALCDVLGKMVAKMHDMGIIHGDLTTSNFIVNRDATDLVCSLLLLFFSQYPPRLVCH